MGALQQEFNVVGDYDWRQLLFFANEAVVRVLLPLEARLLGHNMLRKGRK
jgi:hypothetical protein